MIPEGLEFSGIGRGERLLSTKLHMAKRQCRDEVALLFLVAHPTLYYQLDSNPRTKLGLANMIVSSGWPSVSSQVWRRETARNTITRITTSHRSSWVIILCHRIWELAPP